MKTKPTTFIKIEFLQKNNLFKLISILIYIFIINFFLPTTGSSFSKPLSKKSKGENYSHILKSDNFSLNARNVKVLSAKGNTLWIGTSMGLIKYDTSTINNYKIYFINRRNNKWTYARSYRNGWPSFCNIN